MNIIYIISSLFWKDYFEKCKLYVIGS